MPSAANVKAQNVSLQEARGMRSHRNVYRDNLALMQRLRDAMRVDRLR